MRESLRRYIKPCMTNIPGELGKQVISTIINTPLPDFTEVDKEISEMKLSLNARARIVAETYLTSFGN